MAYQNDSASMRPVQRTWRESTDPVVLRATVLHLKRAVEVAYFYCRDEEANSAHDDLICAEWRLRNAERRSA